MKGPTFHTADDKAKHLRKVVTMFDSSSKLASKWIKDYEANVSQLNQCERLLDSDLYAFLSDFLSNEDLVWFYGYRSSNAAADWKTFKEKFCEHFSDVYWNSMVDLFDKQYYGLGCVYSFCEKKLEGLNKHFPKMPDSEKIKFVLCRLDKTNRTKFEAAVHDDLAHFICRVKGDSKATANTTNKTEDQLLTEKIQSLLQKPEMRSYFTNLAAVIATTSADTNSTS